MQKVLENIRKYNPAKLYVFSDGPQSGNAEEVATVREIFSSLDFQGEVKTNFLAGNLGPGPAINRAIDWFFENEDEGVILEEDCVPTEDFFLLAEHVLERYRHDERVWGMTGSNTASLKFEASYGFIRQPLIWGWATWADRWDKHRQRREAFLSRDDRRDGWPTRAHKQAMKRHLDSMARYGVPDTWDYPLALTVMKSNGLWVVPSSHLVDNVGAGPGALNSDSARFVGQELSPLGKIVEPSRVEADDRADLLVLRRIHGLLRPMWLNVPLNFFRATRQRLFHAYRHRRK